jgi:hypothetical protein
MTDATGSTQSTPRDDFPVPVRLTASTARRISHQIDRAVQGTYGAHDGLRELVHLGTNQMLIAGATRDIIRREISSCIADRCATDLPSDLARSRHAAAMAQLTTLMLGWTEECSLVTSMKKSG